MTKNAIDDINNKNLMEQIEEMSGIIESITNGVLIYTDIDHYPRLSFFNKSSREILGYDNRSDFERAFDIEYKKIDYKIDKNNFYLMKDIISSILYDEKEESEAIYKVKLDHQGLQLLNVKSFKSYYNDERRKIIIFTNITGVENHDVYEYAKSILSVFRETIVIDLLDETFVSLKSSIIGKDKSTSSNQFKNAINNVHEDYKNKFIEFLSIENLKQVVQSDMDTTIEYKAMNSSFHYQWYRGFLIRTFSPVKILFCVENITNIKNIEEIDQKDLNSQSMIDRVTGLITSKEAEKQIIDRLRDKFDDEVDTMIVVEVNNFASIVEEQGKNEGERILRTFSKEISRQFFETGIMYRSTEDKFVIYLKNIQNIEFALKKISAIENNIRSYSLINGESLSCSIGFYMVMYDEKSYLNILNKAVKALYEAKRRGLSIINYEDLER